MSSTLEPEKTESKERMWSPRGAYSQVQESTAENGRDPCFREGSQNALTKQGMPTS